MKLHDGFFRPGRGVFVLVALLCMQGSLLFAQTGVLRGKVTDGDTGEEMIGATIRLLTEGGDLVGGAMSNVDGLYTITPVNPGKYKVKVSYVGYQDVEKDVKILANQVVNLNFEIKQANIMLDELVIVDASRAPRKEVRSHNRRSLKNAKKSLPPPPPAKIAHAGEPDSRKKEKWNREAYKRIYENDFKSVKSEPLSTFSIDVDAASYSNSRRYLQQQQSMPPQDAVRIEEFINYFSYDYPQPKGEHPFSINMEVSDCPWNEGHQLIHIGLQGKKMDTEDLSASNLVFLVDVSGSMGSENKLPLLKKAFTLLVKNLRAEDRVSLVVYAGAAGVVLPSTSGDQKETILNALNNLQSGGSTAGGAGIRLAYKIAKENFIEGGNNRVILATDGDFNVGESSDGAMTRLIEEKRESGVFLTTLGFGMGNYQDTKMELLADKGNGNYFYIDNVIEAKKVFTTDLYGTLFTIAKDVKLQLEFNPQHVREYRLIGYENRLLNNEDFNDDTKDAGELGVGHTVTALYEVVPAKSKSPEKAGKVDPLKYQSLTANSAANSRELLTVKFRYKEPDAKKSKLIEEVLSDKGRSLKNSSDNFRWSASVALFGMLLRGSKYLDKGDYAMSLDLAKGAKGEDSYGYRSECIRMMETAEMLSGGKSRR